MQEMVTPVSWEEHLVGERHQQSHLCQGKPLKGIARYKAKVITTGVSEEQEGEQLIGRLVMGPQLCFATEGNWVLRPLETLVF